MAYLVGIAALGAAETTVSAAPGQDARWAALQAPLATLVAKLDAQSVDARPLRSKAREGLAKGVPPQRLLLVLTRYTGFLLEGDRQVTRRFKRAAPKGLRRAYADARLAGVKAKRLGGLLQVLSPRNRRRHAVVTVDALTDLLSRGHLTRAAYGMVLELARKGRFKQILQLRGTLVRVRKRYGLSLSQAGVRLEQALTRTGADLPRALDRMDQNLPVVDPSVSTRGVPASTPGMGTRGP